SPSSDLYTVGRALAVLTFQFTGFTGTYKHSLPDPATVPLFAQQESFYRLLRRATDPDPGHRFASAGDMAEQLTGVLREVLEAAGILAELAAGDQADWRTTWYQGLRELAAGQPAAAGAAFDAVYDALPGELAPQLALGFAAEAAGDQTAAARYFERVWTVDRSYVSAAFGLARARLATGDRAGAIAALAAVPPTSSHHVAAQIAAVRINITRTGKSAAGFGELRQAADRLERLPLDAAR